MTIIRSSKTLANRHKYDFYRTPRGLAEAALRRIPGGLPRFSRILDPGAGTGVWGQEARKLCPDAYIVGVEYQDLPKPDGYDAWVVGDYLSWCGPEDFDLVIGNPPFNLAEDFIYQSVAYLKDIGGQVAFLMRSAFLESRGRYEGLFRDIQLEQVLTSVRRVSWTQDGHTDDTSFSMFYWRETSLIVPSYTGGWLDWNYKDDDLLYKGVPRE